MRAHTVPHHFPSLPPSRIEEAGISGTEVRREELTKLGEQVEELARLEDCALEIDLPGWTAEEWGAKPMSARSIVAKQRDHRRDRGKSESNAME